jgi:heme-degrading monooxygenase HmoA
VVFVEIFLIYFKSGLNMEDVLKKFEERADKYRNVQGLLQKLYIREELTDRVGGVYIFDSKENLEAFRNSDTMKSIGDSHKLAEPPTIKVFDVVKVLYEGKKQLI